ncbi:hypothetical protein AB0G49_14125 [Streptomyces longwoodensis]|uniref:hypothetical protein n=1 Tax=Streptomyces longwoodensis TaxID=68231 RepID=UPI0033D9EC0E
MEGQSITAWRTQMVRQLAAARERGDVQTAHAIERKLLIAHLEVGRREAGTRDEQNTYLLARLTRTPLPELKTVGIDTNTWPEPPKTPSVHGPQNASPDTERRIRDLFREAGPLSDRKPPAARYRVDYRPQDNERHHGELQAWAMIDTETNLPVAYFAEQDWAEYQADQASDRFAQASDGR